MSKISELENISSYRILFYILLISSLVCSGAIFILIFNRTLFLKLEAIKLLILSMGISIPIFILNFLLTSYSEETGEQDGESVKKEDGYSIVKTGFT